MFQKDFGDGGEDSNIFELRGYSSCSKKQWKFNRKVTTIKNFGKQF